MTSHVNGAEGVDEFRHFVSRGGSGMYLVEKCTAALFSTLIASLQSWSHFSSSDKWVSRYLTRSDGCLDVATRAVSSGYWASFMWWEDVGISFTNKLKTTEEITLLCSTPARMMRQEEVSA